MPKNEKTALIAVTYGSARFAERALRKEAERLRRKYGGAKSSPTLDIGYFFEVADELEKSARDLDEFFERIARASYAPKNAE